MWTLSCGAASVQNTPSLALVEATADYQTLRADARGDWALGLLPRVEDVLAHWNETGSQGRFRCLVRQLEGTFEVGSRGQQVVSRHAAWAPSECPF